MISADALTLRAPRGKPTTFHNKLVCFEQWAGPVMTIKAARQIFPTVTG